MTIPVDAVRFSKDHIRKSEFSTGPLKGTIADAGLLQPILAQKQGDGFVVIDGARRLAALRELGVQELIVGRDIVIDNEETEADRQFKQIIANVQREDLNDIELGQAFVTLKESSGYRYNEIAEIIGKTPHFVAAKVGLIKRLDPEVRRHYLQDLSDEKCTASTFCANDERYVININVLEDIARSPQELQLAAYREIRAHRMDQETAIAYLRTLKKHSLGNCGLDGYDQILNPGERKGKESVLKHVRKINREIECLQDYVNSGISLEPETTEEIRVLAERLNVLCMRMQTQEAGGLENISDRV